MDTLCASLCMSQVENWALLSSSHKYLFYITNTSFLSLRSNQRNLSQFGEYGVLEGSSLSRIFWNSVWAIISGYASSWSRTKSDVDHHRKVFKHPAQQGFDVLLLWWLLAHSWSTSGPLEVWIISTTLQWRRPGWVGVGSSCVPGVIVWNGPKALLMVMGFLLISPGPIRTFLGNMVSPEGSITCGEEAQLELLDSGSAGN